MTEMTASKRGNLQLLALALGAFGIGVSEFAPMGMLPVIAAGVEVSIPSAGMLISAYAAGVMIGAPLMTLIFSRFGRKTALMALMGIFTLGNLLSTLAPDYWTLVAARLVTSMSHGAFFGLGAVAAANAVPKERQASAVAFMFMGLTIANIGGVPVATWIGQEFGWRIAFAGTVVLGLMTIASLFFAFPAGARGAVPDVRKEIGVLIQAPVLLAMLTTILAASSMFSLYTYVTPILERVTGASGAGVTFSLMLIGIGFTIGNWLGGRLANWSTDGATAVALVALSLIMFAQPLMLRDSVSAGISLLIWGAAAFAVVPPIQTHVMRLAKDAPGLASSINVGAFNLGNAIGAILGSAVLRMGLSFDSIPVAGAITAALALVPVWLGRRLYPAAGA